MNKSELSYLSDYGVTYNVVLAAYLVIASANVVCNAFILYCFAINHRLRSTTSLVQVHFD